MRRVRDVVLGCGSLWHVQVRISDVHRWPEYAEDRGYLVLRNFANSVGNSVGLSSTMEPKQGAFSV